MSSFLNRSTTTTTGCVDSSSRTATDTFCFSVVLVHDGRSQGDEQHKSRDMPSLNALAGWEAAVLASLSGTTGTLDEKDRQITRSGLYAEYPAVLRSYLDLLRDDDAALEALKRAVILVWLSTVEPSPYTGIAELPERDAREAMQALEDRARFGALDEELVRMLAWYQGILPAAFELHGANTYAARAIVGTPHDAWRGRFVRTQFTNRGQLGTYWQSVLDSTAD
jgi:hypothetical protein